MILMNSVLNKVDFLLGDENIAVKPLPPYADVVCEFLNELSIKLLGDKAVKNYADVVTFAFWCRKANLAKLKGRFNENHFRLGRGLLFHITPTNVPINFAFSYVFGLLSGNANIVRVSTKIYPQIEIVLQALDEVFKRPKFALLKSSTAVVRYAHDEAVTSYLSSICDMRIIWGGNHTIEDIRKCKIPVNSTEIVFPDRYSFCVLCSDKLTELDDVGLKHLANGFYHDTYLNDQNACSAPHLIVWTGKAVETAKIKFWQAVYQAAQKYDLAPVKVVDKYLLLCEQAIVHSLTEVIRMENLIYRVILPNLPDCVDGLRGKFGLFYEYEAADLDLLAGMVNKKYQTITYFGETKERLADFVQSNQLRGIDRIVPVGSAMEMNVIWDGYDLVRTLSRIIHVV